MPTAGGVLPQVEVVSLQQRLEQIEAAINEAHLLLNKSVQQSEQSSEKILGEDRGAYRLANGCISRLADLNDRLRSFTDLIRQF